MQVNQPKVSAAKASTVRERPPMASKRLDLPATCEICGKARNTRKHQRCSRLRQKRQSAEWASYMANQAAKKAQEGRRYAR